MGERAAWQLREVALQALDGNAGALLEYAAGPVGELWPGTIFEAGGKEFLLLSNRGDEVFGARISGGVFDQGVSFPTSYPVTVVGDSRAVERDFWERRA
jgi:hypothetical protein